VKVYKFLSKEYGLKALQQRRLKIARLSDLNDPFELLPFDMSTRVTRLAVAMTIHELNEEAGVVCFSRTWSNPVIWAHYADQHRGLCLGFELSERLVHPITYVNTRQPFPELDGLDYDAKLAIMRQLLFTKFEDWRYEDEVRASVQIDTEENGLYFVDWSDAQQLTEVIVGMRSATCRRELERALVGYEHPVQFIKAQASHSSFAVDANPDGVRNHDDLRYFLKRGDMWHPVEFVR
jgi:Protein of unknown function (DUF2971)